MRSESAAKGSAEVIGELRVHRLGKCSYRNLIKQSKTDAPKQNQWNDCYFCGAIFKTEIVIEMGTIQKLVEVKK